MIADCKKNRIGLKRFETPLVRYRVQRFTTLGISFACRGERGVVEMFGSVVSRKRERKKNSTGWPRDGIIREGFFRTSFPTFIF